MTTYTDEKYHAYAHIFVDTKSIDSRRGGIVSRIEAKNNAS